MINADVFVKDETGSHTLKGGYYKVVFSLFTDFCGITTFLIHQMLQITNIVNFHLLN